MTFAVPTKCRSIYSSVEEVHFRRLPHFSGRCHSKKCRAIFMFGWPQTSIIKFPFSSVLETTPIACHMTARRLAVGDSCSINHDCFPGLLCIHPMCLRGIHACD